jgi:hypothetical protein
MRAHIQQFGNFAGFEHPVWLRDLGVGLGCHCLFSFVRQFCLRLGAVKCRRWELLLAVVESAIVHQSLSSSTPANSDCSSSKELLE